MSDESLKPVILITGLPGEGKTLYAVSQYLKGKTNAYAANLNTTAFPKWDADKWYETPPGSVIVVDEAWRYFPPRNATQEPPEHYKRVPEIRHNGHVLVLITQDPHDLDARIRRRVGRHYHVVRVFGSERANIHVWNECQEDVKNRTETESFLWEYDREAYPLYVSTKDKHRIKVEIPAKLKRVPVYLALAAVGIVGGLWFTVNNFTGEGSGVPAKDSPSRSLFGSPGQQTARTPAVVSPEQWLQSRQPRIPDLPHTAPAYDSLTTPTTVPVIAACIDMPSKGCKCYTQQATPLTVSLEVCRQYVAGGMFQEFDPAPSRETVQEDRPVTRGSVPETTRTPDTAPRPLRGEALNI